jgi:hypothetical protein
VAELDKLLERWRIASRQTALPDDVRRDVSETLAVLERIPELERQVAEGSPGVMHEADAAFYRLTVQQRDAAWRQAEQAEARASELEGALGQANALLRVHKGTSERLAVRVEALQSTVNVLSVENVALTEAAEKVVALARLAGVEVVEKLAAVLRGELGEPVLERDRDRWKERAERLEAAATEMLKFGAHGGLCTNHDDASGTEPCTLHVKALNARAEALRAVLAVVLAPGEEKGDG